MFPGFDISEWDGRLIWMWQWSNLRFVGFYLAHSATGTITSWTRHLHDLRDLGWGLLPVWLPFSSAGIDAMKTSNGTAHGTTAVVRAREAGFEKGTTIYLDVESPIDLTTKNSPFVSYLRNWMQAVRNNGYAPGVYCSRLNAGHFLNRPEFRPFEPIVWPFSITAKTRAGWDDNHFQLTEVLPADWIVHERPPDPDGGQWTSDNFAVGCQYDWFNAKRDRKIFHWPGPDGHQNGYRDVDWDMAKVFDPAHPRSAAVITMVNDHNNTDWAYVFQVGVTGVGVTSLGFFERMSSGRFTLGQELALQPGDIGPRPPVVTNGFDPAWASTASRRHMHVDVFLLGQDGFIRTAWMNNTERFPSHPWPLNPLNPARRGSPIAAVSRTLDQLDVFYVDRNHHLVTQWWSPIATRWELNLRVLVQPSQPKGENNLVAGGTNLVALPSPHDGLRPTDRLDVFYISLNYAQAYIDSQRSPQWGNAWNVVHATWSTRADWQLSQIPNLTQVAASSGVAAVRDTMGIIHVVVQERSRRGLMHASLASTPNATWIVRNSPGSIFPEQGRPCWWMSLYLCAFADRLLLFGMTNTGRLAWAIFAQERWSKITAEPVRFATSRPLTYARRGAMSIDIVGTAEDGSITGRSLIVSQNGAVNLGQSNGLQP